MPNWCEQDLYVRGNREDLIHLMVTVETEESLLDHNKIIPMPESLKTVPAGSGEELFHVWFGDLDTVKNYEWIPTEIKGDREKLKDFFRDRYKNSEQLKDVDSVAERYKQNMENYGCSTWYDWACNHWGTKWGICHVEREVRPRSIVYTFDSAWSPAEPIIRKLSEMYPRLTFRLKYYEAGMAYKGSITFKGGEVLDESQGTYRGWRGG